MTPTRLTLWLFGVSAALVLAGGGFLAWQAQQAQTANAKQDAAITALTTDANRYRSALQNHGVNPSSVAPPPATRVEQVTGDPGQPGAVGQQGIPGQVGPSGSPGTVGPSGPAGAAGADGANGTNGTNGSDGKDGTNGRGVSSTKVTQDAGSCTMTVTYTDGTTENAGSWSCPAAPPTSDPGSSSGALIGLTALSSFRRRGVLSYAGQHRI